MKYLSHTRTKTFKQCPLKAKLAYIDKIAAPQNEALARGNAVHKEIENFLVGKIKRMSSAIKHQDYIKALYKRNGGKGLVEYGMYFDYLLSPIGKDTYLRYGGVQIKADYIFMEKDSAVIVDWKTGKHSPYAQSDYVEQLEMYAVALFRQYPKLKNVEVVIYFVDSGTEVATAYTKKQADKIHKELVLEFDGILKEKKYIPTPNRLCEWCHYRKSNKECGGGQCKFG